VITSTISVLVVYPAIYYLWRSRGLKKAGGQAQLSSRAF
jgi:hypothetical protein